MSAAKPVTFSLDADGVGWITLDDPVTRANVFNAAMQEAFAAALDAATKARALVIISAKEKFFSAGADLQMLASLPDEATATEFARAGQKLFQRLADFSVPVVCAIHGACAGGGFELALACHWRIASDASVTQIGLPETGLGIIPGWGGSVRLPRLIGVGAALDHILKAQLQPAHEALRNRFVDEIAAPAELRVRAKIAALKFTVEGVPALKQPGAFSSEFFAETRESVLAKTHGQLPALLAAIDVVEQASALAMRPALEIEAHAFGIAASGTVSKNLLHVYFLREAAKKRTLDGWFESRAGLRPALSGAESSNDGRARRKPAPPLITRVGVVGAGVMGSGIAHWLAARGCEVVLRDVRSELVERGLGVIRGLFDEAVQRKKISAGEAVAGLGRIATTAGWDGFARCDLVIEAIVENVAEKQRFFSELEGIVRPDTLLASNTSALPIEEIAGHVANPERTLGLHFFNPVSRMSLVELVIGRHTSELTAERALAFVKSLGKTPVICRSAPGFLVTRILFFYLNEAVRLWEEGVSTTAIDGALSEVGWPMGPMRLIDEVGIAVTDFIFGELAHYFPDRFARSTACARLLLAGLEGRKNGTGAGFFRYDGRTAHVNDAATRTVTDATGPRMLTANEIIDRLMGVMIGEARRCINEGVVQSPDDVDFALLTGAGFPAFHGGLMRYAQHAPRFACEVTR